MNKELDVNKLVEELEKSIGLMKNLNVNCPYCLYVSKEYYEKAKKIVEEKGLNFQVKVDQRYQG